MKRRAFLRPSAVCTVGAMIGRRSLSASGKPVINTLAEIQKLQLTSGPMAGAFVLAPYGYVNWYFANVGLLPFVKANPAMVKAYMNLSIQRLDPAHSNIADVLLKYNGDSQSATIAGTQIADSDDAYAATFLSLAALYDLVTNDRAWWNANVATLKNIACRNLALGMKPTGLVRVYQNSTNTIGYCEDNCQNYRGMRDFANRPSFLATPMCEWGQLSIPKRSAKCFLRFMG